MIDTRPLSVPTFRRTWIGNSTSYFGFQFTAVAVPVQMFAITGSATWVGLLGVAGLVPLLIFGLWGGAAADVVDRRKLLLVSSVVTWVTTVVLLVQAVLGVRSGHLLLLLTAIQAAGFAVSSPARQAIVPRIVPEPMVPSANTLNYTASTAGGVLGPLAAGVIMGVWSTGSGVIVAYAFDALLFTVTFWATWRLPAIPPAASSASSFGASKEKPSVGLRGIAIGLKFLVTQPVLLLSFGIDLVAMVFAMPRALFPVVAEEQFGGGSAVGWLYSAIAIGAMIGGLTSGWIGRVKRQGLALIVAVVGWGLAIGLAGLAHSLWLMVLLLALAGMADLVSAVYRQTIMQTFAPDHLRGRLQGVFTVVVAGGPRLGDLRAGATADLTSVGTSWVGGGLVAAGLAVVLGLASPALIRYRPERDETDDR
ncbi:MFS transporter [Actinoplanes derwentensis]|uniref:Predicted arabinose efflux permease, MFS family n=1 Tax=Actinoplanes derwentensis TaxID=113562 RepID=A0A1H2CPL0_9ACTN|nr:MFS transporter [Actinoplanes derwentensis]SDT72142.1 Predicted arabinose efflux permease, MFS family [Actinoplanes derwentensis]